MRLLSLLALIPLTAGAAVAKECRMPDLPPGVQVPIPPECRESLRTGKPETAGQETLRGDQGFIDLGNGTRVRAGGRVRAEYGVRR